MRNVFKKKSRNRYTMSVILLVFLFALLVGCGEKNPHQQTEPGMSSNSNVEVYPDAGTENGAIIPEDGSDSEPEDTFVPDYLPGRENVMGNTMTNLYNTSNYTFGGYLARQDLWVYYPPHTGYLCKFPVFEAAPENYVQLVCLQNCYISCINVIGDWIYFLCQGHGEIWKVRTDGSMLELVTDDASGTSLLAYKNYLIFKRLVPISASDNCWHLIIMDTETQNVVLDVENLTIVGIWDEQLYVRCWDTEDPEYMTYQLSDLKGSPLSVNSEDLPKASPLINGRDLWGNPRPLETALVGNTVFYVNGELKKVDLDTKTVERVNGDCPDDLYTINDGYLYYMIRDGQDRNWYRIKEDGTGWQDLSVLLGY